MKNKTCCFIGHRKIERTFELEQEIYGFVENLIVNEHVKRFLFGSKSDFNDLCHRIVTKLKAKYPEIKRVGYTCKSESVVLENEREKWEQRLSQVEKREVRLLGVEEEFEHKTKYVSGKASYIERNQAMIDDSDFCVFYYNEKTEYYNSNSGTAIAFKYAKRKKKMIKNFYIKN